MTKRAGRCSGFQRSLPSRRTWYCHAKGIWFYSCHQRSGCRGQWVAQILSLAKAAPGWSHRQWRRSPCLNQLACQFCNPVDSAGSTEWIWDDNFCLQILSSSTELCWAMSHSISIWLESAEKRSTHQICQTWVVSLIFRCWHRDCYLACLIPYCWRFSPAS